MFLPMLENAPRKTGADILTMRGINYSDQISDGDLADSLNISARRFPYISTRRARQKQNYSKASAMTAWARLVVVKNDGTAADPDYELYYPNDQGVPQKIGQLSSDNDGKKQFAVVNTRLVIWPDKKYLDMESLTIKSLAAHYAPTGATFATNSITFSDDTDLTTLFGDGDGVEITDCATTANNKSVVIKSVETHKLNFSDDTFTAATESGTIHIDRNIPDMDFICESENRLWGCSSEKQTIYASALGKPDNFNVFENLSTDSYALAVGTEGDFTGCCRLSSSILFWKENVLHKILGSYPAEYQMYQYTVEGLRAGCSKSLQVINETLFYMGLHGVFAFAGGTPTLISPNFGEKDFSDAVAGNDGDSYYLSCKEGETWHLFVYETKASLWVHEDNVECVDFARLGRDLYFLDASGDVWLTTTGTDDANIEWFVQYAPFYEIGKYKNKSPNATMERKKYSKIVLRLELPLKSYVVIYVRTDNGAWQEVGQVVGQKNDVARVRVPITRCDKFEVKIKGKGPCAILSFRREYALGSEV